MRAWSDLSGAGPCRASTGQGEVRGLRRDGVSAFLGLAYAAPPVGPRRWMPPAEASPWTGVYDATCYPNRAPQEAVPANLLPPGGLKGAPDEDCLYLNIFTPEPFGTDVGAPAAAGARRPVLVWIHGGGYRLGSGNDTDLARWCVDHDFVVVSINYRLGMLGFLDLSRFGPQYRTSASLGFQDMIAALRWVRSHIADYGGDPDCVTIMGGSAGAGAVLALMAAPAASGLFHRVIAVSPLEIFASPPDVLTPLAAQLGLTPHELFAWMRDGPADDIVKLQSDNGYHIHGLFGLAAADGEVIVAPTPEAIRRGVGRVRLIAGATREEGAMIAAQIGDNPAFGAFFEADMAANIGGGDAQRYTRFLDALKPGATPQQRMERAYFDFFRSAALRAAQALGDHAAPAWVYSFEAPTDHPFGATHGADIRFVANGFGPDSGDEVWFYRNTPDNARIAQAWSGALARFARTGDPNGPGLAPWPHYTARTRDTLCVGADMRVVRDLDTPGALAAYGLVDEARAQA